MNLRRTPSLLLAPVIVLLLAACSSGASPTPTAVQATPTAAPASPTEEANATSSPAEATATPDTTVRDAWRASASVHRGQNDEQFEYDCPPGGEPFNVWGDDIYTDDSSVCTAAVHAGVITLAEGGSVTIEIRPGEDEYESSDRNGISTFEYPAWGGSFVVIDD
jgi:LCCL domain